MRARPDHLQRFRVDRNDQRHDDSRAGLLETDERSHHRPHDPIAAVDTAQWTSSARKRRALIRYRIPQSDPHLASATLMVEEFLSASACNHANGDDASGVSIVSREAAMCASLIRTALIVNRAIKEILHAESQSN